MRKINYLIGGIILLVTTNAFCQTTYLLTFSAKDTSTSAVVALDKVYIKNETTGEDITITDTFLFLNLSSGILENSRDVNTFSIYQNFNNVKGSQSSFNVKLPKKCKLLITVYDITAKELCNYHGTFDKGIHTFGFEFGADGVFIISANNGEEIKTFKAYNKGIGNTNAGRITLIGSADNSFDPIKKTRGSIGFSFGDQMKYVGYTAIFKNDTIIESPTGDKDYVFEFSNFPPSAPTNPIPADGSINQPVTTSLSWSPSSDHEGDPVTYDIYFGTSSNPVLVDSNISDIFYDPGTLDSSTIYYWKIVAKDVHNNLTIGNIWEFTTPLPPFICGSNFLDIRDSHTYKTVEIGDQCWMAENLAYLPSVSPSSEGSYTTPYYYVYDFEGTSVSAAKATSNYQVYGVLYNWPAAMNGASSSSSNPSGVRGVCPVGWHLPSDEEWKELELYLGMSQSEADDIGNRGTNEGSKLAGNASLWVSGALKNDSEFGTSGFTALPSGYRVSDSSFGGIGSDGGWWSSTETSSTWSWSRHLWNNNSQVSRSYGRIVGGFSFRCTGD